MVIVVSLYNFLQAVIMNFYLSSPTKKKFGQNTMLPEVDAIVENFTDVDEIVYELWLRGLSIDKATAEVLKTPEVQEWGADIPPHTDLDKIVAMDTQDQYRIFAELEKVLYTPQKLADDCTHQICPRDQKILIEKYYTLDDCVVREIIGKKLSGRNRKELDDVAEKTGIPVRSCRRQFDNIKRAFKVVEDSPGALLVTLQTYFLLPDALARKYGAVVFLLQNRFETNKRKLNHVTAEDFYSCAFTMMEHWSGGNKGEGDAANIDREFLVQLRDLRMLLDREKEHKSLMLSELRKLGGCPLAEAEAYFKVLTRPLCAIATALHTTRELRDLFVDVCERVVEPARAASWSTNQLTVFLTATAQGGSLLLDGSQNLRSVWERYMRVMLVCVVQLHRA